MKQTVIGFQAQMRRRHVCTHMCVRPSVRPSVLPPFSRFVSGLYTYARVGAYTHAYTRGVRAAIMSEWNRCSLWSLCQLSGSTKRQRKSTVDILPTVLCVRVSRSPSCVRASVRPSVPIFPYCCIQVSACSQCAKTRDHSLGVHLVRSVIPRSRRSATGASSSISSGRICQSSAAMSVMPTCFSSSFKLSSSLPIVTRRPRSKYMYIGAIPNGIAEYRTRMDPDHILLIPLKNDSVPAF